MEHIERAHPFRVTLCEVVVHRHHVYAVTCQCIEEHRACSHQCLTLTRRHLGNLTLMQHRTTEELHVIMHHLPLQVIAACSPVVVVYSLVTVYRDEVLLRIRCQFTVKVSSSNHRLLVLSETASRILNDRESHRIHHVECLLQLVQRLLLQFVYLVEYRFTLVNRCLFNLVLKLSYLLLLFSTRVLYELLYLLALCTEFIIAECLYGRIGSLHLIYEWLDFLNVAA